MSYISDWRISEQSEWDYVQYSNAAYREDAEERYYRNHYGEYDYDEDEDYEDEDED